MEDSKRSRGPQQGFGGGDKFETRLLIPSKMGGAVIGKKGCNIQQLRSEYNAMIRIPDAPGPERIMSVTCEDYEACCCVIEAAIPFMYEQEEDDSSSKEIRLLVNQGIVGGIIGKGGAKIKEIRETSGANVKAYQNCAPQVVMDNLDRVQRGVQYDPANFDAFYGDEYGGWGNSDMKGGRGGGGYGGRGGGPSIGGRGGYGGRQALGYEQGGFGGDGEGFAGGFNAGGGRGAGFGGTRVGGGGQRSSGGGRGGGGFGGFAADEFSGGGGGEGGGGYGGVGGFGGVDGAGFGGGFAGATRNGDGGFGGAGAQQQGFGGGVFGGSGPIDEGPKETQQVTIPKSMAGAIIGPGGQRIRKIRADSKAGITLAEANENDERVITIEGTTKQIQTAQYLLQQAVKEHQGPRDGGGFRGSF